MGGACASRAVVGAIDLEAIKTSRAIDEALRKEAEPERAQMKMLLLGPGESGKSTLLKQMRIIHCDGFSVDERIARRAGVYSNAVLAAYQLILGAEQLSMPLLSPGLEEAVSLIRSLVATEKDSERFTTEVFNALSAIWYSTEIRLVAARRGEFSLNDSAEYFLNSLERLNDGDYIPSVQDILMTRVATTGVQEIAYNYKDIDFRIFDVGGQRSERRKWIHCFDNVNAVIFVVALSEYDQMMREDNKTNRMVDSLQLFGAVINSPFFDQAQALLFLNKKDLFEEKIHRVPLTIAFPKYYGKNDFNSTVAYIQRQFEKQKLDEEKMVYIHLTCATSTDQVQFVLTSATDMIIADNFKHTGVI